MTLEAELFFARPTRQRLSRNAELLVPPGTTLTLTASMQPELIDGEAVARPRTWELTASRNMTFVYRGVTVARADHMRIRSDDPELRVQAIGSYRLLSALATAHRYYRQNVVKHDFEVPDRAVVNASLRFKPDHRLALSDSQNLITGEDPSELTLSDLQWKNGRWTSGRLNLRLALTEIEPLLQSVAAEELADPIEIGSVLEMHFRRLHTLTVEDNRMFVHVNGSIAYANSERVTQVFEPSFESRLEIGFGFPEGQRLRESEVEIRLNQVHSFDINRSHNLLDKSVRNLIRGYRDEATVAFSLSDELPETDWIPDPLLFETFRMTGNGTDDLVLEIQAVIPGS
jgi:hypothetical protein